MVKPTALLAALTLWPALAMGDEPATQPPVSADAARARLSAIVAKETPDADDLQALADLAKRTDDPALAALASYDAGALAVALNDPSAPELLRAADAQSPDPAVRSRARYNLAHAALTTVDETKPPATIEEIDQRIAAYTGAARLFRSALDADANNTDAGANTERLRRKVRDLQQQRDQLQKQQQALQQLADQLKKLAKQQGEQGQQNQQQADQSQQPRDDAQGQQQSLNQQTSHAAQQAAQNSAPDEAKQAMQDAQKAQQEAQKALEQNDAGKAAEQQQKAAEALKKAAEAMGRADQGKGDQNQQDPQQQQGEQPQDQQQQQPQQSAQEPQQPSSDPLAEALLDKERRERAERMQYLQRSGRQHVERDW